ncbi:N-acetylglucosamine kinase [Clostridium ganghwense]|uniref:ATPase n=1 Tax=Clostridium ganghwense TaxID=312089 RepID=A0ABT4CUG6_9CLOT|nr:BadF/BadG/BcrA/BcrD ATPase family protein [Clostridium ganghwense]MCY6371876.1 ATPase [Clostridium ganghwense]
MKYIIGVDGGGTKTEAAAYTLDGEELKTFYGGYGNLVLNKQVALNNIASIIEECINYFGREGVICISLGLAGVEAGDNKNIVKKTIEEKFKVKILVYNDAEIAMAALLKGEDGILTIAGTGSISIGTLEGKKAKSGGWGHLLGDEGSGYYIGIETLKLMIQEDDEIKEKGLLTRSIMKYLNIKEADEIKGFVYSSTKDEIAALTPVVVSCAEKGDNKALIILKNAGEALGITTIRVAKKLGTKEIKVGIKGSIITRIKVVRKAFEKEIKKYSNSIQIVDDNISSAKGAYYLARKGGLIDE